MASRVRDHATIEFPQKPATAAGSVTTLKAHLRTALARKVRELRLSRKMNQRDLAEQAEMRQALISQIERAEANPTLDSIAKIAAALEVSITTLFE
jgi:ribosome-binding protein aMBF1 (putative translation factor)